jgi:putative ABC transport system permease protein
MGAPRSAVSWMILKEAFLLTAAGITVGLPAALASSRLIQSMFFGIGAADPEAIGAAVFVMASVAAAASFLPARRASRVDPLEALRYE